MRPQGSFLSFSQVSGVRLADALRAERAPASKRDLVTVHAFSASQGCPKRRGAPAFRPGRCESGVMVL